MQWGKRMKIKTNLNWICQEKVLAQFRLRRTGCLKLDEAITGIIALLDRAHYIQFDLSPKLPDSTGVLWTTRFVENTNKEEPL